MKILFLDQSGNPGGAELCLLDIAKFYRDRALVGLFVDGPFRQLLEQQQIHVQILAKKPINVHKESKLIESLASIRYLMPLILRVAKLARDYDLIYANTQKALVVGAIASWLSRRPLVYHLHDLLSAAHFSSSNRYLAVTLANRFASLVIANSQATKAAFIAAGGRPEITEFVYNGFAPEGYQSDASTREQVRQHLELAEKFVVGHFSRLSPWKGQHILIEALTYCPEDVVALIVGDALFGESEYVQSLHQQVKELNLKERVKFLGFRSDVVPLMAACDLIAHTSTSPEPFGRVIVEAMLCGKLVVASEAGGAMELIEPGVTGFLVPPKDPLKLARIITSCRNQSELKEPIIFQAQKQANQRFLLTETNQQLDKLLRQI